MSRVFLFYQPEIASAAANKSDASALRASFAFDRSRASTLWASSGLDADSSTTSAATSCNAALPGSGGNIVSALRGWFASTTIAGRGRASSPAPEGQQFSSPLSPFGRWQTGRTLSGVGSPSVVRCPHLPLPDVRQGVSSQRESASRFLAEGAGR